MLSQETIKLLRDSNFQEIQFSNAIYFKLSAEPMHAWTRRAFFFVVPPNQANLSIMGSMACEFFFFFHLSTTVYFLSHCLFRAFIPLLFLNCYIFNSAVNLFGHNFLWKCLIKTESDISGAIQLKSSFSACMRKK